MTRVSRPCIDGGRHAWEGWKTYSPCNRCGGSRRSEETYCFYASYGGLCGRRGTNLPDHVTARCYFCEVRYLRKLAAVEQIPVKARMREEEDEVLALYGWAESTRHYIRWAGGPHILKEGYPKWLAEKQQRTEQRRQRALLREGHQTLTAIRRIVRHEAVPSQLPESRPERTSQT